MSKESKSLKKHARILLIHLTSDFDTTSGLKLTQALEKFFSLACNLNEDTRLSYFGLVTFGSAYKILLPLQAVKGNYLKVALSLTKVRWQEEKTRQTSMFSASEAVMNCFSMFDRHMQVLKNAFPPHMELTIMSMHKNRKQLRCCIQQVTKQLNFQHIQKIQLVYMSSEDTLSTMIKCAYDDDGDAGYNDDEDEEDRALDNLTEEIELKAEALELHGLLMGWLHHGDTDHEFLCISFPSGLRVKCDAQERFLDPLHLPVSLDLSVMNSSPKSSSPKKSSFNFKSSLENLESALNDDDGIHNLEVLKVLRLDGVCESLFFGKPLVLRATSCWRLEWEELAENRENFEALCSLLASKQQALLVVEQAPKQASCLRGHYVVLPSSSCLLVKAVITSELLLPINLPHPPSNLPSLPLLQRHLDQLECLDAYNPLQTFSNILTHLCNFSNPPTKKSLIQRKNCKPNEVVKQKIDYKNYNVDNTNNNNNNKNNNNNNNKYNNDNRNNIINNNRNNNNNNNTKGNNSSGGSGSIYYNSKNTKVKSVNEVYKVKSNNTCGKALTGNNINKTNNNNNNIENNNKRMLPIVAFKSAGKRRLYTPKTGLGGFPTEL